MDFETMKIGDGVHVSVNGVPSNAFARRCTDGEWAIMIPQIAYSVPTKAEAVRRIAEAMGTWYTATEAAERLVEMGAYDKPPSAHDICLWARNGLLPGSVKIRGKGGAGQGGSWRIPQSALEALAERRGR